VIVVRGCWSTGLARIYGVSDRPMSQRHWDLVNDARASLGHPGHQSNPLRTTKLYDRTGDAITLDEVEKIAI
jgi:hypothetical protein